MLIRKLGKILLGTATPFQLFAACVLGACVGFMPGFAQAPGLIALWVLLLIILNANLALAALVGALAKLLSLLLMPTSFAIGRFLLDGPTQPLFKTLINAPVLAWFGFDYYVTTGGTVLGLVFGLITGALVVKALTAYRRKMAALEEGSERYRKFVSRWWVKLLLWLLAGSGKGKKTYEELLAKKVGNPIRPLGVVFAVLLVVVGVLVQMFASGPIVTAAIEDALERANGATVDLARADLDLKGQRLTLEQLAMADPNALDTDLFRANRIEADISGADLLRKRLQIDRVLVSGAEHGVKRAVPGQRVGPPPEPEPAPKEPNTKTLDDYIKAAKLWKERLAQVRRWLEKIQGTEEEPGEAGPAEQAKKEETLQERLRREIEQLGYARVRASHLIEGAPTLTVAALIADGVKVRELPGETVSLVASNLSTHPARLDRAPYLKVKSSKGTLDVETLLGVFDPTLRSNVVRLAVRGLPAEKAAAELAGKGPPPVQGGTLDLMAQGSLITSGGVQVDLPLQLILHDATLRLPGGRTSQVSKLVLPVALAGPLDNPRVKVDPKALSQALAKAGAAQAVGALTEKAQKALGDKVPVPAAESGKKLLQGILGGNKKK